jgi:hypothetical protein
MQEHVKPWHPQSPHLISNHQPSMLIFTPENERKGQKKKKTPAYAEEPLRPSARPQKKYHAPALDLFPKSPEEWGWEAGNHK